jgi:hypothetical protein
MTEFVTQAMRNAADEARNAALREDENDQIGVLNAALVAAFAVGSNDTISEAARYKSMFDDAVAQMERAEAAETERDEARQTVRDIHRMARRYASGRQTYAPGMFNDAIREAVGAGWLGARESGDEPLFADDPAVNAAPCTIGSAE